MRNQPYRVSIVATQASSLRHGKGRNPSHCPNANWKRRLKNVAFGFLKILFGDDKLCGA